MAWRGQSIVGYDNLREEYHSVWFDNSSTGMMVSQGTADDAGNVTFVGTHSDPMTMEKEKWAKSIMSADGKTFTDVRQGARWRRVQEHDDHLQEEVGGLNDASPVAEGRPGFFRAQRDLARCGWD